MTESQGWSRTRRCDASHQVAGVVLSRTMFGATLTAEHACSVSGAFRGGKAARETTLSPGFRPTAMVPPEAAALERAPDGGARLIWTAEAR